MKRALVSTVVTLIASSCSLANSEPLPAPPFVINCGPRTDDAQDVLAEAREQRTLDPNRLIHLPDGRYRTSAGYGHRGGEGYRHWHGGCRPTLGPQWETDLFGSGRVAPHSYSFALPAGNYQVTIGICEGVVHVSGQRVFDVIINGTALARNVDPIAMAGYKEPMMLAAGARVEGDRPLTVSFRGKSDRSPIVSAIWVTPATDRGIPTAEDNTTPTPPTTIRAVGSYRANLISWHRPQDFVIAAFSIRRRVEGEDDFELITPHPVHAHRWIDRDVEVGKTYAYQVASRDGQGRESWSNAIVSATPLAADDSSIPCYSIYLPEDARRKMLANVHEDHTERGGFVLEGKSYPIEIRIRGASTRHAAKKSYRIRFTDDCPLARKVTYLKAEPMDHTMQQEKLSCDLFRAAGAIVSQAEFVNVFVNDRYEGVYLDIEPVRSPFKTNEGLDPGGTLIRASTFQHLRGFGELGELRGDVGSVDQLEDFIQQINHTPRGEFEQFVREHTDWPRVRDYLALIVLSHRTEIEANDYFFYRAPDTGRWSFIPWDHNNGNFHIQSYQNRIGEPDIHVFPQTIQQLGWQPDYWYVLPSRIFQTPVLRREYLDRLEQLTKLLLVSGKLAGMIDDNFQQLRTEYPLDPHRWPFMKFDPFESSADELKRFVRRHARHILAQVQQERRRRLSDVVINEISFCKENGWIELHNRGDQVESLARMHLVSRDAAGNWRLSLRSERDLPPGEYRVIRMPHRPATVPRFADAEARERWELDSRRSDRRDDFPGYSPDGGFAGLVRRDALHRVDDLFSDDEDDDRQRERVLDFYFYGPQQAGKSYGRLESGFGYQNPTPNAANTR